MQPLKEEILARLRNIEESSDEDLSLWNITAEEGPLCRSFPPIHFEARTQAGAFYMVYKYVVKNYTDKKRINKQLIKVPFDIIDMYDWDSYLECESEEPSANNFIDWMVESSSEHSLCRITQAEEFEVVKWNELV
jgi:hypothetical protein